MKALAKKTTENCTLVKLYKIKSKIDIKKNKINIGWTFKIVYINCKSTNI